MTESGFMKQYGELMVMETAIPSWNIFVKSGQNWRHIRSAAILKQFGGAATNGTLKEYGIEEVLFLSVGMVYPDFPTAGFIGVPCM